MAKIGEEKHSYLSIENVRLFTKESFARGKRYYYEGKVNLTYRDDSKEEYHANVSGSQIYAVRIDFHDHLIKKAICNCPYRGEGKCKHIAATLFAIDHEQGGEKGSVYERLKEYVYEGMRNRSLVETLNRSFLDIQESLKKKELSLEELPKAIASVYEFAHSYFFIGDKSLGIDAVKRVEGLLLPKEVADAIYTGLFHVFFDEAKQAFFLACLKSDFFQKSALHEVIHAMEESNYYEYRTLLAKEDTSRFVLASLSNKDLEKLLSLSFSYMFAPASILTEIKRRKTYSLLSLFTENKTENYEASFLKEVGALLEKVDKSASKKAYQKMLVSRGLTLNDFLFYYRSLSEKEKKESEAYLQKIAFFKGYEKPFSYLLNHDPSLLRSFSLVEWTALAPEIHKSEASRFLSYLIRSLENALSRKKVDATLLRQILSTLDAYPDEVLKKYREDSRLLSALSEISFPMYFSLLYRHSSLEEVGYHRWEE